ncbi:hypothetical protein HID58_031122, partial [Brassica napus]
EFIEHYLLGTSIVLVSAIRVIRKWENQYSSLSIWYQSSNVYLEMFDTCKTTKSDIYYGPKKSVFVGYHSVDIVAIEIFKGQLVAPCKMSNDTKIVNQGYVRVSLGVTCHSFAVHPTLRSHHLLSDFCCVIWMRLKEETSSGN